MLNNLRARRDREEGFTLIELMVVVLIIAILIAIAIPTFLGARERAQDRAAQSSLRNALTAAKTAYTDNSDYSKSTAAADLPAIEPSLTYEAAGRRIDGSGKDGQLQGCQCRPERRHRQAGLGGGGLVEVGQVLLDQGRRDRRRSRDVLRHRSDLHRDRGTRRSRSIAW